MKRFKLKINRIWQKTVETKFGPKEKYSIEFVEKPKVYIDSWVGEWNKDWKTGDLLEFSETELRKRQYNGREYFTLMAPEAKFNAVTRNEFDILVSRVEELERRLEEKQEEFVPESETEIEEEAVDSIPF